MRIGWHIKNDFLFDNSGPEKKALILKAFSGPVPDTLFDSSTLARDLRFCRERDVLGLHFYQWLTKIKNRLLCGLTINARGFAMSFPQKPSDCHPDLQEERLSALAQFFATTRLGVANLHDASSGDDGWSLGCRSFARWRNNLLKKAKTGEWPWLNIVNPGKRFVFGIGVVPVRFFRGSISRPPERTLFNSVPELNQLSLAFEDLPASYRDLKWRFAIETGFLGEPTAIVFAGLGRENGSVVHKWNIPFVPDMLDLEPPEPKTDDMVELPPPSVLAGPGHGVDKSDNAF